MIAVSESSSALITACRECIGTPFEHQGRTPGVGLDCVGLVLVGLRAIGLEVPDVRDYAREPRKGDDALFRHTRAVLGRELPAEHGWDDIPGAVLGFAVRGEPYHLGVRTALGMVHALAPRGQNDHRERVKEHAYDERWRGRCVAVWLPPGALEGLS